MKSKTSKSARKSKAQRKAELAALCLKRYRAVLLKVLYDNCQSYSFFPVVLQFLRSSDWAGLYGWTELAATEVCSTAQEHFAVAQIVALVKKYPFDWRTLKFKQSPTSTALDTFMSAERRCARINKLFRSRRVIKTPYAFKLEYMRRWIRHVLGERPDLIRIYNECNFGPGANLGVHGNATNLFRKLYSESWTVSQAAIPYALGALKVNTNFILTYYETCGDSGIVCLDDAVLDAKLRAKMQMVSYNGISFVPKTAKTDRTIAVEPLLNSFLQSGIDAVMRDKLRAVGLDLRDQDRNKYLARLGSIDGLLATMDLSSASDTVSYELVRYLLPPEWFDLLNCCRSACYELDGAIVPYEKFCSMGNGFCFPLETLIFAAAARASMHELTGEKVYSVYGDDIILPSACFTSCQKLLAMLGFTVNKTKSFSSGPFRESCGADWYLGQDVRPVYLEDTLANDCSLRILHNVTLRGPKTDIFFEGVREYLRNQVPLERRYVRPDFMAARTVPYTKGLPDDVKRVVMANLNGAFDVPLDVFMVSSFAKWSRKLQNWQWRECLLRPVADSSEHPMFPRAQYLAFLSGTKEGVLALRRLTQASTVIRPIDKDLPLV
jgi:hypothetical protein